MRRYTPTLGGHAPEHLREILGLGTEGWPAALLDEETNVWWDEGRAAWWAGLSAEQRARWITGQLWNCTDIMPSGLCVDLDLPLGSTYARAARHLRSLL